jgi:hypothetical protein
MEIINLNDYQRHNSDFDVFFTKSGFDWRFNVHFSNSQKETNILVNTFRCTVYNCF